MPEEAYWNSFFDPELAIIDFLGSDPVLGDVTEYGCGYGTFTKAIAKRTKGTVNAIDIEESMLRATGEMALVNNLDNIKVVHRDVLVEGSGLSDKSQDHVMIYNLLHIEDPLSLLKDARRILKSSGSISVMHWRSDIETPRGPSLDIRPTPEQCGKWLESSGFTDIRRVDLSVSCPFHFGLLAS